MECTKVNCPMQVGTPTDNCGENCPWRTTANISDLITRAAALDAIDGIKTMQGSMEQLAMKALCWAAVKMTTAVDAVPVIRCASCKWWNGSTLGAAHRCAALHIATTGEFYCAAAERKSNAFADQMGAVQDGGENVRLVDADKQLEWVDCMKPIHGIGLEPVVAVETVRDLIKGAPTIDAIPVEWLREKMRGYASALKSTELKALVTVMQMWQKEQGGV